MAKTYHPDVSSSPDASDRFKEISEAYAILSIESLRKEYDQKLKAKESSGVEDSFGNDLYKNYENNNSEKMRGRMTLRYKFFDELYLKSFLETYMYFYFIFYSRIFISF